MHDFQSDIDQEVASPDFQQKYGHLDPNTQEFMAVSLYEIVLETDYGTTRGCYNIDSCKFKDDFEKMSCWWAAFQEWKNQKYPPVNKLPKPSFKLDSQ